MIGRSLDFARGFGIKRLAVLVLGAGFVSLAFDAAVGHVADAVVEHPSQVSAIVVPLVCAIALLAVSIPRVSEAWLARVSAIAGWLSVITGAAGTFFHVKSFVAQFAEVEEITFTIVRESLGVSPPVFAPSAFIGVGALLLVLASPRLRVEADAAAPAEGTASVSPAKA